MVRPSFPILLFIFRKLEYKFKSFDRELGQRHLFTRVKTRVLANPNFAPSGPCIAAFQSCRPVISIDGTHLYGKYKHKLLIATSVDSDNHIMPLAFALVYEESFDSWSWFLSRVCYYVI